MNLFWVYCFENTINGKRYFGKTKDLNIRFKSHIKKSKSKFNKQYIHNAISKYGISRFIFRAVYYSFSEQDAFDMERYLISLHNTMNSKFGYNQTSGGEGSIGFKHSNESKLKLSNLAKLKTGKLNPFFGKSHSEKIKNLSRGENNKQAKLTENSVINILNTYYTGKYTEEELAFEFKISRGTVNDILRDKKWKHVCKDFDRIKEVKLNNKKKSNDKAKVTRQINMMNRRS